MNIVDKKIKDKGKNVSKLISVIIPSYGRVDSLRRAIKSVLNQTYKNFEILIIDDNASQTMAKEIDTIANSFNDVRIRVIHNNRNLGGALTRNVGIENAKGEYIAFLDDDDQYLPTRLEKQYNLMEKSNDPKLALVYCWTKSIDEQGNTLLTWKYNFKGNCIFDGMYDCIAPTSQWFCRKEALQKVGSFTDMPCKQDSYVLVKLLINGYKVDRVKEILTIYDNDGKVRISTQGHKKRITGEEKLLKLCRANYNLISQEQQKEVEYSSSTRLAEHYLGEKKYKDTLRCLKKVILKHPLKRDSLRCYKHCLQIIVHK